jgi:hypothetical protein
MADAEAKVKAVVTAEDKTGPVFEQLGQNLGKVEGSSKNLTSALTKLGLIGVGLYTGSKILSFFSEGAKMAEDDARAKRLLVAQVENLGVAYGSVSEKIESYAKRMVTLGEADEQTNLGLTQLLRVTKNVDSALEMSTLAYNLAASGIHTYSENVDMLQRILLGKGIRALTEYGVEMDNNASIAEQLVAVQKLVTTTIEIQAETSAGQLKRMNINWQEFQTNLGEFSRWFKTEFATTINETMGTLMNQGSEGWGTALAKRFAVGWTAISKGFGSWWYDILHGASFKEAGQNVQNMLQSAADGVDELNKTSEEASSPGSGVDELTKTLGNLGDAGSTVAEDMQKEFIKLSKTIVSSINDQVDAIDELKKSLKELEEQTSEDLAKSDEKYKQDVINRAKRAEDRIKEIDKQIADEQASESQGFRGRITDLQAEKDKEQSIINRASGEVSNLKGEIEKDDLTQLEEAHTKEINEIKNQADKKKAEMEKEKTDRETFLEKEKTTVETPGFYEKATKEGLSFLGGIGAGAVANSFVFNFNGDVNDKEALEKSIIDALNRMATLHNVSGK